MCSASKWYTDWSIQNYISAKSHSLKVTFIKWMPQQLTSRSGSLDNVKLADGKLHKIPSLSQSELGNKMEQILHQSNHREIQIIGITFGYRPDIILHQDCPGTYLTINSWTVLHNMRNMSWSVMMFSRSYSILVHSHWDIFIDLLQNAWNDTIYDNTCINSCDTTLYFVSPGTKVNRNSELMYY